MRPFLLLLLFLASPAHADTSDLFVSDRLSAFSFGVFCTDRPMTQRFDADRGWVAAPGQTPAFPWLTTQVPLGAGAAFGVLLQARAPHEMEAITVTLTPPAASGLPAETWRSNIRSTSPTLNYRALDTADPAAQGLWRIEAEHDGQVIYRVPFLALPPFDLPDIVAACGQGPAQ